MPHPPGRASKAARSPRPGHTRAQEVWKQSAHTTLQGNRATPSHKGCSVRSLLSPASVGQQKGNETPSAKAGPAVEAAPLDRAGARGRGQLEFPTWHVLPVGPHGHLFGDAGPDVHVPPAVERPQHLVVGTAVDADQRDPRGLRAGRDFP